MIPEAEGGSDQEANAAPLCPTCHERYGGNPSKRKFILEARDLWFEICADRYAPDSDRLGEIQAALTDVATKSDLAPILEGIETLAQAGIGYPEEELPVQLSGVPVTGRSLAQYLRWLYPHVTHCGEECSGDLARDLANAEMATVDDLHLVLSGTGKAFAAFARDARAQGFNVDSHTNNYPAVLFLALWDERFCKQRYPGVYERNVTERSPWHWRRPA